MPLLTQGKTNWKYIFILLILAVVVGGGILVYLRQIEKKVEFSEVPGGKIKIEKESVQLEKKEEVPEEKFIEYTVFTKEIAYRDIWYYSRLPIRTLFIPKGTKINRIEAFLEALNFDPSNQRHVGIAIGAEIPNDCQAGYYLTLNPKETASRTFELDTALFQTGDNVITAWVASEVEWGGGASWVSLTLKIYYQGKTPQISDQVEILKGPIDPIECMLRGTYRSKRYKYEIQYPKDWSFYESSSRSGEIVYFYPPGKEPKPGGEDREITIHIIEWLQWYKPLEEWVDLNLEKGIYRDKKEIIFGRGDYQGIEVREKIFGLTSYARTVLFERNTNYYSISIINENSIYMPVFDQMLSTFRFLE